MSPGISAGETRAVTRAALLAQAAAMAGIHRRKADKLDALLRRITEQPADDPADDSSLLALAIAEYT